MLSTFSRMAMEALIPGILLGIAAWTAWALRRTKLLWLCIPLSLPLVCALSNMTCYYYSLFITLCAFGLGASTFIFVYNAIVSWIRGEPAPANPWRALTLEWR